MSVQNARVAKNMVGILVTQLFAWAMTALVTYYLPRYIHDSGMGKLAISSAMVMLIGVIVPLGTSQVLIKEIARDRSRAGSLFVSAFTLRLVLGVIAIPLAYLAACLMGYSLEKRLLILVSIPGMVVFVLNDVFASVYQGFEEMKRFNRATMLDKFVFGIATLLLIILHAPLWMIAAIPAVTGLVTFIYYVSGMGELLKTISLPKIADMKALAMASLPFMGLLVFRTLYGQTDPIILGAVATDAEVGWYAMAFRLVGTAMFFPMALVMTLLPTLARLHGAGDRAGFASLARKALDITLLVGLPIAAAAIFLAKPIVNLLYGSANAGAVPVLSVGGIGMLLYFVTAVLGLLVMAMDRQAVQIRGSIIACLFGIPLCILFSWGGHRLWGNAALGAMISDVVVEVYLGVVYWRALPRGLFSGGLASQLMRYVFAAVPMIVGLFLSLGTNMGLWAVFPCALLYLVACVLLRCWSLTDLKALQGMLVRRTA
jgi:O-antigen/teichoic acid export membrane protein